MKLVKVSALLLMTLFFLGVTTAGAQTNLGLYGLGLRVGLVFPEDPLDNAFGLGVQVPLGTLTRDLHLDLFGDFWTVGYDDEVVGVDVDIDHTQFSVGGMLKYYLPIRQDAVIFPYGGAGLAAVISSTDFSPATPGVSDETENEFDVGLHLAVGTEFQLTEKLNGLAEIKYAINGADYLGVFVGVIFQFMEFDRGPTGNGVY